MSDTATSLIPSANTWAASGACFWTFSASAFSSFSIGLSEADGLSCARTTITAPIIRNPLNDQIAARIFVITISFMNLTYSHELDPCHTGRSPQGRSAPQRLDLTLRMIHLPSYLHHSQEGIRIGLVVEDEDARLTEMCLRSEQNYTCSFVDNLGILSHGDDHLRGEGLRQFLAGAE